ncbi:methylmalonyl Co-A mutase-associated GTPase MeaB [Chloroflexota bacterium]
MKNNLASRVMAGDIQAAARLISHLENEVAEAIPEMAAIYPHTGKAYIVGITGTPGAGKSTLTDRLISRLRKRGLTVGVVAIDPSSAFTGGAILGDRVRMQRHSQDEGVFIRSLATRGWIGGLAKSAIGAVHVMDAMGRDVVLVETVGSGQIEIDITRAADSTLVLLTPGAGDEIQMMKAGILEAADIFVINKADKDGADNIRVGLESMLAMQLADRKKGWEPNVVLTQAINDKGTAELVDEIFRHKEYLVSSGELVKRQRERARLELLESMESYLKKFLSSVDDGEFLEKLIDDLMGKNTSPHSATLEITARFSGYLQKMPQATASSQEG